MRERLLGKPQTEEKLEHYSGLLVERNQHVCGNLEFVRSFKRLYQKACAALMTSEHLLFEIDNELQFPVKVMNYIEQVVSTNQAIRSISNSKRGSYISEGSATASLVGSVTTKPDIFIKPPMNDDGAPILDILT